MRAVSIHDSNEPYSLVYGTVDQTFLFLLLEIVVLFKNEEEKNATAYPVN